MHVANVCIAVSCAPEPHGHVSLPQRDRLLGPKGRASRATWRAVMHISGGTALLWIRAMARPMAAVRFFAGTSSKRLWCCAGERVPGSRTRGMRKLEAMMALWVPGGVR